MPHVTSKDGTRIAYDKTGGGAPVILVDGAFCYRQFGPMPKLATRLAERFTVVTYDRRGRGESGDTAPYSVEREVEDIRALVDVVGGAASLVGLSSGAVLAMRAAASGLPVRKLALYEPPLVVAGAPSPPPDRYAEVRAHVEAGRRGKAVGTFMRMVGMPAILLPFMRIMPGVWSRLTAVAHTLPYDFDVLGDTGAGKPMPEELRGTMASIKVPTLVGLGGKSPPYMRHTAETVAKAIPGAQLRVLEGQTHNVSDKALAPILVEFLGA